jgi:sigma-E factor negative regulatory protein RseB
MPHLYMTMSGAKTLLQAMAAALGLFMIPAGANSSADMDLGAALMRMSQSLHTLTYTGTLVYLHGHQLETLHFSHILHNGQELEQLVPLDGTAVPSQAPQGAASGQRAFTGPLWPNLDLARLDALYQLRSLGEHRIVGRMTQVVGIIPRDDLRYGYRFYLDKESGLPLKTDLMGQNVSPIEQVMFTALELGSNALILANGKDPLNDYRAVLKELPATPSHTAGREQGRTALPWTFAALPAGFVLQSYHHDTAIAGMQADQLILSDGLATVSVYVEPHDSEGLQGAAHIGAVNAWGVRIAGGYQVTAVGEVPEDTVRQLAQALRRRLDEGNAHD